jgi:hypothetical protein
MKLNFDNPKITLKRGCTEFEDRFGDSSKWDELAVQQAFDLTEHYLAHIIEPYDEFAIDGLFQHKDSETFRFWIEYAHGIGAGYNLSRSKGVTRWAGREFGNK